MPLGNQGGLTQKHLMTFLGLMSTGSLRDMEAREETQAMGISPMEQEATSPEAPAIEESPSPPREGECADQCLA